MDIVGGRERMGSLRKQFSPYHGGIQGGGRNVLGKIFNTAGMTGKRKSLRNNMPEPEQRLWAQLRGRQLKGYKFRRQASIDGYVVDFYCPELKLAVEIDGDSHFVGDAPQRDRQRQAHIGKYNIRFLRFTNVEISESLEGVVEEIMNQLPAERSEQ